MEVNIKYIMLPKAVQLAQRTPLTEAGTLGPAGTQGIPVWLSPVTN